MNVAKLELNYLIPQIWIRLFVHLHSLNSKWASLLLLAFWADGPRFHVLARSPISRRVDYSIGQHIQIGPLARIPAKWASVEGKSRGIRVQIPIDECPLGLLHFTGRDFGPEYLDRVAPRN